MPFTFEGYPYKKEGFFLFLDPYDVHRILNACARVVDAVRNHSERVNFMNAKETAEDLQERILGGYWGDLAGAGGKSSEEYRKIKKDDVGHTDAFRYTNALAYAIEVHNLGPETQHGPEVWAAGISTDITGGGRGQGHKDRPIWKYAVGLEKNYKNIWEEYLFEKEDMYKRGYYYSLLAARREWK